jgi:hypothetical protein
MVEPKAANDNQAREIEQLRVEFKAHKGTHP